MLSLRAPYGFVRRHPLATARGSVSAEDVAHLVEQPLVAEVFLLDLGELFEEAPLLARERGRRHHGDRDVEVAAPATAQSGHAGGGRGSGRRVCCPAARTCRAL